MNQNKDDTLQDKLSQLENWARRTLSTLNEEEIKKSSKTKKCILVALLGIDIAVFWHLLLSISEVFSANGDINLVVILTCFGGSFAVLGSFLAFKGLALHMSRKIRQYLLGPLNLIFLISIGLLVAAMLAFTAIPHLYDSDSSDTQADQMLLLMSSDSPTNTAANNSTKDLINENHLAWLYGPEMVTALLMTMGVSLLVLNTFAGAMLLSEIQGFKKQIEDLRMARGILALNAMRQEKKKQLASLHGEHEAISNPFFVLSLINDLETYAYSIYMAGLKHFMVRESELDTYLVRADGLNEIGTVGKVNLQKTHEEQLTKINRIVYLNGSRAAKRIEICISALNSFKQTTFSELNPFLNGRLNDPLKDNINKKGDGKCVAMLPAPKSVS